MAIFNLNSGSIIAQTLAFGDVGFVGTAGNLVCLNSAAITISGGSQLTVLGSVVTSSFSTLAILATTDDALVTVGATGTLISSGGSAISGTVFDQFHLINDGLITGFNEAIAVTAVSVAGVTADFHIANSGRILSNGDATSENTVEFVQAAGATIDFANSGVMMNGGLGGVLTVVGGRLDLTNSGTIQARKSVTAISTDVGADNIVNDGNVIGGVSMGDGSDYLANNGKITGGVALGNGSDLVNNSGTIIGGVNLSDTLTTGAIADTLVNSGLITGDITLGNGDDTFRNIGGRVGGTVSGGLGNDRYFIDRSDIVLNEALSGGSDSVTSTVSFALGENFERLVLIGPLDLRGIGNDLANSMDGGDGDDVLRGGRGQDVLQGGRGDDRLFGGDDNDLILALQGDDLVSGGAGQDLLIYAAGNVTLNGGTGFDVAEFANGGFNIINLETGVFELRDKAFGVILNIEDVTGSSGIDTIIGDAKFNRLLGADGADSLVGGGGGDLLAGEGGRDTLTGGSGEDQFVFTDFSLPISADLITDFAVNEDRIDLREFLAIPDEIDPPVSFLGTGAFTNGPDAEVRFFTDTLANRTTVEVHQAGSQSTDMVILLTGLLTLTQGDFLF